MDCLGAEAYSNRCLLNKNGLTFVAFLLIFSLPYAMYIFLFFVFFCFSLWEYLQEGIRKV